MTIMTFEPTKRDHWTAIGERGPVASIRVHHGSYSARITTDGLSTDEIVHLTAFMVDRESRSPAARLL
jgi:hypothetical protein